MAQVVSERTGATATGRPRNSGRNCCSAEAKKELKSTMRLRSGMGQSTRSGGARNGVVFAASLRHISPMRHLPPLTLLALCASIFPIHAADPKPTLTLAREQNWLIIRGPQIPGGEIRINYLEAYCRAGSTDADWVQHTVIKHTSEVLSMSD